MCTLGAVSTQTGDGHRVVCLIKNMDSFPTPFTHSVVNNTDGYRWINFTILSQAGTNSGLNEAGLGVVISGSDYRWMTDEAPGWRATEPPLDMHDMRTVANAAIMSRCASVDDAVNFLSEWIPAHPDMMGANHMFADRSGRAVVVEHCAGQMAVRELGPDGCGAQANNSRLLLVDKEQRRPGIQDSYPRCERMEHLTATLKREYEAGRSVGDSLSTIESVMGSHDGIDGQVGAMCIHGLDLPGARANVSVKLWTISTMVLDVANACMHYTVGNPCMGAWTALAL